MKYTRLIPILLLCACTAKQPQEEMTEKPVSDTELKAKAEELAYKFILTDGHVDLPYRMKVAGFMLKKEIMDVSVETDGNFES